MKIGLAWILLEQDRMPNSEITMYGKGNMQE